MAEFTRILSDIHYGDRATHVEQLAQLRPLLEGVSHLVLNGDTVDTRPGPNPAYTAACRAEIHDFFPRHIPRTTYLTGNHDADFSDVHFLDLAAGEVFVTHGDIFFDNIVPWSADARIVERLIAAELSTLPFDPRADLAEHLALFRRVALKIPQRHQSERNRLKYLISFLLETVWPPLRVFRILAAWRNAPSYAAAVTQRHRPRAKFVISGHTHRAGLWQMPSGLTVINTGCYCTPLRATAVDLTPGRLVVREVATGGREFLLGATLAEFPLAAP
ncbi:MAG: metallophosphoesterase [Verrucomicrobiota bacterium]